MASSFLSSAASSSAGPSRVAAAPAPTPVSSSSAAQKPDRLYVGNLSPTVDEYTLIQIFSRFGKIAKLDYLFHKSGPLRGKPRGFAFVEFTSKDDALKALLKLNDRVLRGRKLSVTYASQTQHPEHSQTSYHRGRGGRHNDPPRTTTLSLIKNQRRPVSAAAQIAALEAKLSTMKNSPLAAASATAPLRAAGETASGQGSRQGSADVDADADLDIEMDTPASGSGTPGPLTEEDIEQEMARLRRDLEADLEQARIAAGLPPSERVGNEVGMSGVRGVSPAKEVAAQDKGKGRADEGDGALQEPVEDSRPVPSQADTEGDAAAPAPAPRTVPAPPALPAPPKPAADIPPKPVAPLTATTAARPRGTLPPPPPGLPRKPPASIHEAAFSRR